MTDPGTIQVNVRLLPPLSNTAGRDRVRLTLKKDKTLQGVIDGLLTQFDSRTFYLHLYDTEGRLVPAWQVFINQRPAVRLVARDGLKTSVKDRDEITFLMALAGG
ncbi:MAG: MoaD/ThiS family protein [Deltaproteobacteria bacterium]|nr:MoaD/ThiS family protein [Deltaproteobacteria bacterium]